MPSRSQVISGAVYCALAQSTTTRWRADRGQRAEYELRAADADEGDGTPASPRGPKDEAYETKKGVTLVMTAAQLVRRLLWLIPPRGLHLTNFHGVFAPHSAARAQLVAGPTPRPHAPAPRPRLKKERRPRIDWATLLQRTFACDVFKCPCGGQRRVVGLVTNRRTAEQMLTSMKLLHPWPPLQSAQGPPQQQLLPDA